MVTPLSSVLTGRVAANLRERGRKAQTVFRPETQGCRDYSAAKARALRARRAAALLRRTRYPLLRPWPPSCGVPYPPPISSAADLAIVIGRPIVELVGRRPERLRSDSIRNGRISPWQSRLAGRSLQAGLGSVCPKARPGRSRLASAPQTRQGTIAALWPGEPDGSASRRTAVLGSTHSNQCDNLSRHG
jgi:hypothetical protein